MKPIVKKRRLLVLFTCAHLFLTISAMVYFMAADSPRFDNPELARAFGAGAAEAIAKVLSWPGRLVWTSWASKNLPNAIENVLFVGNSVVWAAAAAGITTWIVGHRRRGRPAARDL